MRKIVLKGREEKLMEVTPVPKPPRTTGKAMKRIQVLFPVRVYETIYTAIELEKHRGDYSLLSVSNVVRKALEWRLANHSVMLEIHKPGDQTKYYPILVTTIQYKLFMEFPKGARSEILSRIVATYLQACGLY